MEPQVLGPYVISHVVAVIYVFVAWRWPRVARWIAGVGFILAGVFNIWTVSTSPEAYVEGFGRYAIPLYRRFIYGDFARGIRCGHRWRPDRRGRPGVRSAALAKAGLIRRHRLLARDHTVGHWLSGSVDTDLCGRADLVVL
jgi:hypothetical protein